MDSLDTLWLMGLNQEFQKARDWTANSLEFHRCWSSVVCKGGLHARAMLGVLPSKFRCCEQMLWLQP